MRDSDEEQIRIDLAATFRIIAHLGMHEAVANHFSAALSADGKTFLLNPKWKHFSRIRASDLLVLNADDERCAARPDVDATAWAIHGQIHQRLPDVRVVLHLHPVYTTSLACLATPQILPIDQNTARYFNRVAVDTLYGGMADNAAEGARLAGLLADKRRLLMGNHRVLVTAPTIGEAFDDIWTLERACQILITAWSTGQPLKVLSDAVGKTAQDWEKIADFAAAFCRNEAVNDRPRSLPGGLTPSLPGSARAVAGCRQQRHDDIAERCRNAVLTSATLHHAVTNIPLQRSAIQAIDHNRGA